MSVSYQDNARPPPPRLPTAAQAAAAAVFLTPEERKILREALDYHVAGDPTPAEVVLRQKLGD